MNKHNKYSLTLLTSFLFLVGCGGCAKTTSQSVNAKTNEIQVYAGPGLSYQKIDAVKNTKKLDIIAKKNNWYAIRLNNNQVGWVPSWLVNNKVQVNQETNQTAMAVAKCNVYQNNSTSSKKLGQLSQGDKVTVVYQQNNWCQIIYNHNIAWVKTNALSMSGVTVNAKVNSSSTSSSSSKTKTTLQKQKYVVVQQDNTKIRKSANINGKIWATVANGTKLTYISKSGEWYKVKYNNQTGYVAAWICELVTTIKQPTKLTDATIALDPGHGGNNTGAVASDNTDEKTYTLKMANVIAKQLRNAGAKVIMTRNNDQDVSGTSRLQTAANANVLISIHFDASANNGITTYYNTSDAASLAQALSNQLNNLSLQNNGIATNNTTILQDNNQPAVLLELGSMSNDETTITSTDYQQKVAKDIVAGLKQYFKNANDQTTTVTANNSSTASSIITASSTMNITSTTSSLTNNATSATTNSSSIINSSSASDDNNPDID